jgi:predicted DNA-binding protein
MNMRNTKVYSITMPPEMAKQAARLAQKESRTMSELMREAFRRYQLQQAEEQLLADPLRASRLQALKQTVAVLRKEAAASGVAKMTTRQINAAVEAARKDEPGRKRIKSSAR